MKMKRFVAKDMRAALQEVKVALGNDAVIMSNKSTEEGIELMAAVDDETEVLTQSLSTDKVTISPRFSSVLAHYQQKDTPEENINAESSLPRLDPTRYERSEIKRSESSSVSANNLQSIEMELQVIRQLLEHQVTNLVQDDFARRAPLKAMLRHRLSLMGIEQDLSDQLLLNVKESTSAVSLWQSVLEDLSDTLTIAEDAILKQGGVVALVGATGVGKTTTIAKLAARASFVFGADKVALITTDSYRIGAQEQLATYGRIMGCSVFVAKGSDHLQQILQELTDRRLVLIDTAGLSQRDMRLSEQLKLWSVSKEQVIRHYLVLTVTAQRAVLNETIKQFQKIPLAGAILTKLDESLRIGEALQAVIEHDLPIAYITNGQRVPEDLNVPTGAYLVNQAQKILEQVSTPYWG